MIYDTWAFEKPGEAASYGISEKKNEIITFFGEKELFYQSGKENVWIDK